jgi:branched-chain amino acid transport system substrate-binding protein
MANTVHTNSTRPRGCSTTRRRASRRARRFLATLIAVVGLLTAASASTLAATASVPGITPTSVVIGSDQPLTGFPAAGYGEIAPASRAFFTYVNAHGGVHGRAINYVYLDDGYEPAKAVADENQLLSTDHVFAYFNAFGNLTHAAIVESLNRRGVPDLFNGSSCACWNEPSRHPETFGFGTNYTLEARLIGHHVARAFPAARVGYLWEDGPVGCCQQGVPELDREIPASQVVSRQSFTTAELSVSRLLPQVKAAQAAGVQVLVLDTLAPQATALLLVDGASIGYHPTILDAFPLSADPTTVGGFIEQYSRGKASPALENGLITQAQLPSASDTTNPWIRLFREIHDTYEPQTPFDNMTVYGMAAAYTFTSALQHAGRHPTRKSIVAAVNAGTVNSGGPGLVRLDYGATNHDGYPGEQIGAIENGALVLSGPVYKGRLTGPITVQPVTQSAPPRALLTAAHRVRP